MNKLYVIGIGYKPLGKRAREIILDSEIILASNRLFEVFKGYEEFEMVKDKIIVIDNVDETINFIRTQTRPSKLKTMVLLASGDPMFFGIGGMVVKEFGEEMIEILPDLSSIQMAFAKMKMVWDDVFLMSLHGSSNLEKRRRLKYEIKDIPMLLERYNKIAILTDRENNPSAIANAIVKNKIPCLSLRVTESRNNLKTGLEQTLQSNYFETASLTARNDSIKIYVCERLGYPDERITNGTPKEIAGMNFSEPNVVIIQSTEQKMQNKEIKFGLKEDEILHSRGLITKDEVRAVTIHKLRLPQRGVFWDIGAGSGSMSIEVAKLCPELEVFAIERDGEQINNIKENKRRFNAFTINIIQGEAPDALINLPSPDRVFLGGSGVRLKETIDFIVKTPAKIIVINATTIETLNEAVQNLENNGFEVKVSNISISRSKIISNKRHMSALNPVFIIIGEKLK